MVKLVPPEVLLEARRAKRAAAEEKAAKRAENLRKERDRIREQMEKGKVPPSELFKGESSVYSSWNEEGFPLTRLDGEELTKSEIKKLKKEQEQQANDAIVCVHKMDAIMVLNSLAS